MTEWPAYRKTSRVGAGDAGISNNAAEPTLQSLSLPVEERGDATQPDIHWKARRGRLRKIPTAFQPFLNFASKLLLSRIKLWLICFIFKKSSNLIAANPNDLPRAQPLLNFHTSSIIKWTNWGEAWDEFPSPGAKSLLLPHSISTEILWCIILFALFRFFRQYLSFKISWYVVYSSMHRTAYKCVFLTE